MDILSEFPSYKNTEFCYIYFLASSSHPRLSDLESEDGEDVFHDVMEMDESEKVLTLEQEPKQPGVTV